MLTAKVPATIEVRAGGHTAQVAEPAGAARLVFGVAYTAG
ncbi:hypothetical protein GCM10023322_43470 [Rugosimonospora acidiphila]|uniref:Alpha/beta hydrolase n=1 Tax=Rugosimonospora acidiphila TaxID=556531 RepID=A0ABP9S0G3_9ACTN